MANRLSTVTANHDQRLYVIPCGNGVSCLGFDVAETRRKAYLKWLGRGDLGLAGAGVAVGDIAAYEAYCDALNAVLAECRATGRRCDVELTPALIGLEGKRVEVSYPDGQGGIYRTRFHVGKSTGAIPIHLEIETRRSHGGCAAYVPEGATVRVVQS